MPDFVKKSALIFKKCLELKSLKILVVPFFYKCQAVFRYLSNCYLLLVRSVIQIVQPLRQKAF